MEPCCINCKFSRKLVDHDTEMMVLNCCRHAPRPTAIDYSDDIDQPIQYALWPIVSDNEWCGEHVAAPETHNTTTERKH